MKAKKVWLVFLAILAIIVFIFVGDKKQIKKEIQECYDAGEYKKALDMMLENSISIKENDVTEDVFIENYLTELIENGEESAENLAEKLKVEDTKNNRSLYSNLFMKAASNYMKTINPKMALRDLIKLSLKITSDEKADRKMELCVLHSIRIGNTDYAECEDYIIKNSSTEIINELRKRVSNEQKDYVVALKILGKIPDFICQVDEAIAITLFMNEKNLESSEYFPNGIRVELDLTENLANLRNAYPENTEIISFDCLTKTIPFKVIEEKKDLLSEDGLSDYRIERIQAEHSHYRVCFLPDEYLMLPENYRAECLLECQTYLVYAKVYLKNGEIQSTEWKGKNDWNMEITGTSDFPFFAQYCSLCTLSASEKTNINVYNTHIHYAPISDDRYVCNENDTLYEVRTGMFLPTQQIRKEDLMNSNLMFGACDDSSLNDTMKYIASNYKYM